MNKNKSKLIILCIVAALMAAGIVFPVFLSFYSISKQSSIYRMMAPANDLVPDLTSENSDRVCEAIMGLYSKYYRISESEAIAVIIAGESSSRVDSLHRSIIGQLFNKNPGVMLNSLDYCIENKKVSLADNNSNIYIDELIKSVPSDIKEFSEIYKTIVKLLGESGGHFSDD